MSPRARAFLNAVRADAWWEHKLSPIAATGYATAYLLGASLLHLLPTFLVTLLALAAAAAYVSLINDLTDAAEDRASGKPIRFAGRNRRKGIVAIALCCCSGAVIAVLAWGNDVAALACYAAIWLAFALYSLPPVRLKACGLAGVLADAVGSTVFPHLLMVIVVFDHVDRTVQPLWVVLVVVWAFAQGVRAILCHQLDDVCSDRRSGLRTFARLHPGATRAAAYVLFPLEATALVAILLRAGNPLAFAALAAYLLLELARAHLWSMRPRVIEAAPQARILMNEYYTVFYPVSFLVAATVRHPSDAVVLLLQLALFSNMASHTLRESWRVLTRALLKLQPTARWQ